MGKCFILRIILLWVNCKWFKGGFFIKSDLRLVRCCSCGSWLCCGFSCAARERFTARGARIRKGDQEWKRKGWDKKRRLKQLEDKAPGMFSVTQLKLTCFFVVVTECLNCTSFSDMNGRLNDLESKVRFQKSIEEELAPELLTPASLCLRSNCWRRGTRLCQGATNNRRPRQKTRWTHLDPLGHRTRLQVSTRHGKHIYRTLINVDEQQLHRSMKMGFL